MKKWFLIAIILSGCAGRGLAPEERRFVLALGFSRTLHTAPLPDVKVADPTIVSVPVLADPRGARLTIIPLRPGSTTFTAAGREFAVEVRDSDREALVAEQTKEELAQGVEVRELPLNQGVGRILTLAQEIGPVFLTDPTLLQFLRVIDGDTNRKLLLLPKKPGGTDLIVHRTDGSVAVKLYLKITSNGDEATLARQMEEERKEGLEVTRLELGDNGVQRLKLPRDIGPIYLTDPSIVAFKRMGKSNSSRLLVLRARGTGITDLLVHDSMGVPMVKYYVSAVGTAVAAPEAPPATPKRKPAAPRYYDAIGGSAVPVY